MCDEPEITVNGVRLTRPQAMAVRVALQSFGSEMEIPKCLGDDFHGEFMRKAYLNNVIEINRIIHN